MLTSAREEAAARAAERGCEWSEEPVWRIEPIAFDPELVALAREACEQVNGTAFELPSGALHDAASMAPHAHGDGLLPRSRGQPCPERTPPSPTSGPRSRCSRSLQSPTFPDRDCKFLRVFGEQKRR